MAIIVIIDTVAYEKRVKTRKEREKEREWEREKERGWEREKERGWERENDRERKREDERERMREKNRVIWKREWEIYNSLVKIDRIVIVILDLLIWYVILNICHIGQFIYW